MGQDRSLAKGVFSVCTSHLSVVIFSLLYIFILYLDFRLLDGFVYSMGPTAEWAFSSSLQCD